MGNFASNPGSYEHRNEDQSKLGLDYFYVIADLMDDISELTVNLNSDRPPTSSEFNFTFFEKSLDTIVIPERLHELERRFGELDEVELNCAHYCDEPDSHFSIRFHFADENDDLATLTVIRPGYYQYASAQPDMLTITTEQFAAVEHIEAISIDEINRCVASLLYPAKDGDYSFFDQMDLNDGERYEDLMALFQKHADHFVGEETYDLFADDETKEGTLHYVVKNGELITTELRRITHDDVIIEEDGSLRHDQQALLTEIDVSDGASVIFQKQIKHPGSDEFLMERYSPQMNDYDELFDFVKRHNSLTYPVRPERFDDHAAPYSDTID